MNLPIGTGTNVLSTPEMDILLRSHGDHTVLSAAVERKEFMQLFAKRRFSI